MYPHFNSIEVTFKWLKTMLPSLKKKKKNYASNQSCMAHN